MDSMTELFSVEQRFHFVFLRILELCKTARTTNEIIEATTAYPELSDSLYSVNVILSWLADAEALIHTMPDENIPETWETTPKAIEWVSENNPTTALTRLIAHEPEYSELFKDIARYCSTAKSLQDIESHYKDFPVLASKGVQPSYVVLLLEKVGAIEWANGWKTTNVGISIA